MVLRVSTREPGFIATLDVLPEQVLLARWDISANTRSLSGASAHIEIAARLEYLRPGRVLSSRIAGPDGRTVWEAPHR